MAKQYKITTQGTIIFQMTKNNLTKADLCRALNVTKGTLDGYIIDSDRLSLAHLRILSGLFGLHTERLVYLLTRNKPQVEGKDRKLKERAISFLWDIRNEDVL